jgi:hypothetical protein
MVCRLPVDGLGWGGLKAALDTARAAIQKLARFIRSPFPFQAFQHLRVAFGQSNVSTLLP